MLPPKRACDIETKDDDNEAGDTIHSLPEGKFNDNYKYQYREATKISMEGFEIGEEGISIANATDMVPENMKQIY